MVVGSHRRCWGVILVAAMTIALVLTVIGSPSGHATSSFSFTRFPGDDRFDTAARIATGTFDTSDVVVIASGETYADALAGTYAGGLAGAPTLLVTRDGVPTATSGALKALDASKALILGGTGVVSSFTEQILRSSGVATQRLAGGSRYSTAKAIAESAGPGAVGKMGTEPTAIVVSGENYPDALSVGGVAFRKHFPVLLTPADSLGADAKAALDDLGIGSVLLVGGTGAVSPAVQSAIGAMGITVTRLAGLDRTGTATRVADFAIAKLGFGNVAVDLARGDSFADALTGSAHGGKLGSPQLLTSNSSTVGTVTKDWLSAHAGTLASGVIPGGTSAVSSAAESEATAAAKSTSTTTSTSSSTSTSITLPSVTTTSITLPITPTSLPVTTTSLPIATTAPTVPNVEVPIDPDDFEAPALESCAPLEGPGKPFCFDPQPPPPADPEFALAQASAFSRTIKIAYNKPVDCSTVPDDLGFTIHVETAAALDPASGSNFDLVPASACVGDLDPNPVIELTIHENGYFQFGQSGTVTINAGTAVEDVDGKAQSSDDVVEWQTGPPDPSSPLPSPAPAVGAPTGPLPIGPPEPSAPVFVSAVAINQLPVIQLTYSEPVSCRYVRTQVVYDIHVTAGAGGDNHITPTADCGADPGEDPDIWSVNVVLTIPPGGFFQSGQSGTVGIASGAVIDMDDTPQPADDSVAWSVS
jgi:putative cell wall-binding protein